MPKMMGRYFYRREATQEQRIEKVWEHEQIKQLIARRSMMIFNNDRQRELDELWVQEEENQKTAQFAIMLGWTPFGGTMQWHFLRTSRTTAITCQTAPTSCTSPPMERRRSA